MGSQFTRSSPNDQRIVLVRVWNISTPDEARNLRRVLIAVFPPNVLSGQPSQEALSIREFNIGLIP